MKRLLLILGAILSAYSKEIISEFEYGQMLYNNPRGVSCMACHGLKGEGGEIVEYFERGKKVSLLAPNIVDRDFEAYKRATSTGPKIMPRYFLTDEELRAIYSYIKRANRERKDENSSDSVDDNFDSFGQNSIQNKTVNSSSISKLE